jgi:hypothetical protein
MQSTINGKEFGAGVIFALMAVMPIVLLWLVGPIVWKALRTGRLLARGVVYDRERQPRMYYFGVLFWISLFAACSFLSALLVTRWL